MSPTVDIATDRLDALLAPHDRSDRPGVVLGVAHRGRPVYRRGVGLASVELPVVLTPSTRLRMASVTKHFCALAVMLLAEEGRLTLQDRIRQHLPDLPPWAADITLQQLMGHTSGMRCSVDLLLFLHGAAGRPVPAQAQRELLRGLRSVNFAPGTEYLYCNGGYTLLTELVERLSGQPFAEFLQQRVLQPAGLADSLLRADDEQCLPHSATQHIAVAGGGWSRNRFGPPHDGAGGLVSTVDDMLRWMAHLRQPRVGSAATWAAMSTPLQLRDGSSTGYGLGLVSGVRRGLPVRHHSGAVFGGASQMIQVLEPALDVVVIANSSLVDAVGLADQVIDACLGGLPPAPQPARLATEGEFLDEAAGRVVRLQQHDGASVVEIHGLRLPLLQGADGALWCRANPALGATLEVADGGQALLWREPGRTARLPRLQAASGAATDAPAGRYRVPELGLAAEIGPHQDGHTCLTLQGPLGTMSYPLQPAGPDTWTGGQTHPLLGSGALLMRRAGRLSFSTTRTRHLALEPEAPHD